MTPSDGFGDPSLPRFHVLSDRGRDVSEKALELVRLWIAGLTPRRALCFGQIAENSRFVSAKRNEAFVMMQYFGYLRRDPDESGFQFWLNKLNQFDGNFEQAEMVKAFIVSAEYRDRFR